MLNEQLGTSRLSLTVWLLLFDISCISCFIFFGSFMIKFSSYNIVVFIFASYINNVYIFYVICFKKSIKKEDIFTYLLFSFHSMEKYTNNIAYIFIRINISKTIQPMFLVQQFHLLTILNLFGIEQLHYMYYCRI